MKVRTRKRLSTQNRLTRNLARETMPQVRKADWNEFMDYAKARTSIDYESAVDPHSLHAIQTEWSQERVDGIPMEKLEYPILTSRDGYVLDGNHRWIKAGQEGVTIPVLSLGLDRDDALELVRSFPKAEYVSNKQLAFEKFLQDGSNAIRAKFGLPPVPFPGRDELITDNSVTQNRLSPRAKRKLAANARKSSSKVGPNRIDPTQTTSMRRSFTQMLRKRFALLRGRVRKLVIGEDAFGLTQTQNIFCKTGPGGGVDATCSKDEAGIGGGDKRLESTVIRSPFSKGIVEIDANPSNAKLARMLKDSQGDLRGLLIDKQVFMWPANDALHNHVEEALNVKGVKFSLQSASEGRTAVQFQADRSEWDRLLEHPMFSRNQIDKNKISGTPYLTLNAEDEEPTTNRFQFHSSPEKLAAFQDWIRGQMKQVVTSKNDKQLWENYAKQGYARGAGRAFDEVNKSKRFSPGKGEFYEGSRTEFLRGSFGRPETVEKLQLLASRSFSDLENVTEDVATKMGRHLVDGLSQGMHPREVAKLMDEELELGGNRAEVIARTEIIRAHAEGSLDSMKSLGVDKVGAQVEFSVAGDDRVCPECESLQGQIYDIDDARGIIPVHPQCRCAWLPWNDDWNVEVDDEEPTENIFCKTGPGGGVDATCSKDESGFSGGETLGKSQVISHIMKTNPPEQVATGKMTAEEWADRFMSEEPKGYVVTSVHPKSLNAPVAPGMPDKVQSFVSQKSEAPPVVIDSNEKQQARFGGGKLDRAFGLQPHTIIDGKHRVAAAIERGDREIKAIVPIRKLAEIQQRSHAIELEEFAHQYIESKGHTITGKTISDYGPRISATTKEGYSRQWGPTDFEKIADKIGHKFKFLPSAPTE